jgi:hypothetical protein
MQARAGTLVAYPRGRSAMVLYARCRPDETLRRYMNGRGVPAVRRAAAAGARFIRFGVSAVPDTEFRRLLGRFVDRFGSPPAANVDVPGDAGDGGGPADGDGDGAGAGVDNGGSRNG